MLLISVLITINFYSINFEKYSFEYVIYEFIINFFEDSLNSSKGFVET